MGGACVNKNTSLKSRKFWFTLIGTSTHQWLTRMTSLHTILPLVFMSQLLKQASGTQSSDETNTVLTQASSLPEGYIAYPDIGSAYNVHKGAFTNWTRAEELCVIEGGHLAVIDSEKKLEYALTPTIEDPSGKRHVGIRLVNNQWVSVIDGSTLSSVPWAENEPYYESFLNCAVAAYGPKARIRSIQCQFHGDFVCEIPLPSTVQGNRLHPN